MSTFHDNFRVTLLSQRTARIEYSPTGDFSDSPSFFFINREKTIPWPRQTMNGNLIIYNSDNLEIHIRQDGRPPSPANMEVTWKIANQEEKCFPGEIDEKNLGASFSALDNCSHYFSAKGVHAFAPMKGHDEARCSTDDIHKVLNEALRSQLGKHPDPEERNAELKRLCSDQEPEILPEFSEKILDTLKKVRKFPPGYLTRSGLTVIRDTGPMWDPVNEWIVPRSEGHIDLTIIACGDDFKGCLGEIANLAGNIPMLPKWALGVWFSCYRKMGAKEFKKIADDFKKHGLPLDLLVIDNDWHKHEWHGFDWNPDLFPSPEDFFSWLKKEKLHNTFNVHPGFIPENDSRINEFRNKSGNIFPALAEKNAPHKFHSGCVPVDMIDQLQAKAWFDVFHRPITEMGCELWWIDGATEHWDGKDGTAWLNHLYQNHMREMGNETPLSFSRASGMGCHRSTLAFSGDAWVEWEVLAQEVESTIRGACTLMAHWSHDIGGFWNPEMKENKCPEELFIRWTQFGCLSPIMRYHSDHGIREPWLYKKKTFEICKEALQLRMRLVPHLFSLVKEANKTGVAPWRPMCFEFPREEESYKYWHQLMIGESLLFAPVLSPGGEVEAWFPEGKWKHIQTEKIIQGPVTKKWKAELKEIPLFLREGYTLKLAPPVNHTDDIDESSFEIITV
jgi:glycosyl hydrolase family 31